MDEREKTSGNIVSSGETFKIYYYQTSPGLQISSPFLPPVWSYDCTPPPIRVPHHLSNASCYTHVHKVFFVSSPIKLGIKKKHNTVWLRCVITECLSAPSVWSGWWCWGWCQWIAPRSSPGTSLSCSPALSPECPHIYPSRRRWNCAPANHRTQTGTDSAQCYL